MEALTRQIREKAKTLLKDGRAEVVIGYRAGTVPMISAPFFARTEEDCDQLCWSSFGRMNLANFLPRREEKTAIIAKGCDARSAIGQVTENQIARENLYVVGIACQGLVDPDLVRAQEPRPILEAAEEGDRIILRGDGFATELKKADVLQANCRTCIERTPQNADEVLGPPTEPTAGDDYADLKAIAAKPHAERMAYFKSLVKDCLRCYACRNACPLCYCPVCFVDESRPQWLGKSQDEMDVFVFHILRAFHCAGRCTECGACESACPVGLKVRQFTRLLEKEVKKEWGYTAGLSWDQQPPLSVYRPDDPAEFIK